MRRGVRTGLTRRLLAIVAVVCAFTLVDVSYALAASAPTATGSTRTEVSTGGSTGLSACSHRIRHKKKLTKKQIRKRKRHWARLCQQARAEAARQAAYTASVTATATPSRACGTTTYAKADGTAYACSFADEFSGSTLDATKWSPILTSVTGQRTGFECVVTGPGTTAVGGNALSITARRLSSPMTCASPYGDFSTSYTGGMITTSRKFAQTYGRFEMRARFPKAKVAGVQSSLWMFPQNLTYGAWPASGEIDIAEWFSGWGDRVIPHLHYNGEAGDPYATTYSCLMADPSVYHTYAVEWTPTSITFKYDGKVCLRNVSWMPSGMMGPAPFDKPFVLLIGNGIGTGPNAPRDDTPFPSTLQVDYVRAWS